MTTTCSRCNREMELKIQELCGRCQDILEFGYQSFPAYPLEGYFQEDNESEKNLTR